MYQLGWFSTGRDKPCNRYWNEIERYTAEKIKKEQGESNRLFQLIRQRGLAREFPLIIATLKAFNQSKIEVNSGKQVIDAEGSPINGYNLTEEIDKVVKQGGGNIMKLESLKQWICDSCGELIKGRLKG